jgi:hypothetical protein
MDDKVRKIINTNSVDPDSSTIFGKESLGFQRYDNPIQTN